MHVPFEGAGCIENWIKTNNHSISYTRFYENDNLPESDEIDWLIVMGGPMSVSDEAIYPWLQKEKLFIKKLIDSGKIIIGICLGSQLIAEVLGAQVYANKQKEIGWFEVESITPDHPITAHFENHFQVFHWHGDTFELPKQSTLLYSSEVTKNQAFLYNGKILGIQFHFEVTSELLTQMLQHGQNELIKSYSVQTANEILRQERYIEACNQKMFSILNHFQKI